MSTDLPVVDPATVDGPTRRSGPVGAVFLAAGPGGRFTAGNKLLADLDGTPLVRRAARPVADAGLEPRVAVVGHEAARIRQSLAGLGFTFVHNAAYESGLAASIERGLAPLSTVSAAVFALGDMPLVRRSTVEGLVAVYRTGDWSALAAAYEGQRGNPVLFDSRYFDSLSRVSGDRGGRDILLESGDAALVETGDPGVLRDVDDRDDLSRIRSDLSE